MSIQNCPLCNQTIEINLLSGGNYRSHDCPCCGFFVSRQFPNDIAQIKNETASYFYYTGNPSFLKKDAHRTNFVGLKDYYEREYSKYETVYYVTKEEILAFYPRTFTERINKILLGLAKQINYIGSSVSLTHDELLSAFFVKRFDEDGKQLPNEIIGAQLMEIQSYLTDNNLIIIHHSISGRFPVTLLLDGWQRIDELQKNDPNNRDVFIAMSFNPKNDSIKDAIKEGISKADFSPRIMSEEIHGKQIVPMMFRLIRESKLLVMDVTDPNYGAYHEAGYALGLGKEVIITCREEEFNNPDNKPHFDIAQKQILVWKDYEDLTERLSEWIKAIAR